MASSEHLKKEICNSFLLHVLTSENNIFSSIFSLLTCCFSLNIETDTIKLGKLCPGFMIGGKRTEIPEFQINTLY